MLPGPSHRCEYWPPEGQPSLTVPVDVGGLFGKRLQPLQLTFEVRLILVLEDPLRLREWLLLARHEERHVLRRRLHNGHGGHVRDLRGRALWPRLGVKKGTRRLTKIDKCLFWIF